MLLPDPSLFLDGSSFCSRNQQTWLAVKAKLKPEHLAILEVHILFSFKTHTHTICPCQQSIFYLIVRLLLYFKTHTHTYHIPEVSMTLKKWVHDPIILGTDPIFKGSWRLQVHAFLWSMPFVTALSSCGFVGFSGTFRLACPGLDSSDVMTPVDRTDPKHLRFILFLLPGSKGFHFWSD